MKPAKMWFGEMVLNEAVRYVERDPAVRLPKLLDWGDRLASKPEHHRTIATIRAIVRDPDNNWNRLVERVFREMNPVMRRKFVTNFLFNSAIAGGPIIDRNRKRHRCGIPWAILMDPTAACNLNCTGCWASEYGKALSMDKNLLDRIIREGKELGIYMYIYSGGEPLLRKDDLIDLARKHRDCAFLAFTNATLIDEPLADALARVGNLAPAISIEGFAEETDMRRGRGTYERVMHAMDLLKERGVGFGFSTCYHRHNSEVVGSDAYVDFMVERGAMFGWYFAYMPLGRDAAVELLATPGQREMMYHRVREMRATKPIFLLDFWNDGEFVGGCIAGGRSYLHINANGDVEPCAFIHYTDTNIRFISLLRALKSPLLAEYQRHQPFNGNHLRPCPLLDNPDALPAMVHACHARSTQPLDHESVDALADKCRDAAAQWAETAGRLWKESHPGQG